MSDTTDTSYSRSDSSTKNIRKARPQGGKTKFERDIDAAINRGASNCRNLMHWQTVSRPDQSGAMTWTDVEVKSSRQILKMMAPGPAKCMCERRACQWAWTGNWNHKGMYTTQWVLEGMEQKGIPTSKEKEVAKYSAKKVWPLYHSVDESKLKCLISRFPEWHFVSAYSASHDHPLAHYSTKLASERLMDKLPRGTLECPKKYIDLNGNPASNAKFMERNPGTIILTLVECITPKDFINRATKWGPKYGKDGEQLWYDDVHIRDIPDQLAGMGNTIDGFISIHTTYYYDAAEICRLLEWAPNAIYYSSMHKFGTMAGKLNAGEQAWEKRQNSFGLWVTQRNVKTGEAYEHPDNAWWYEHDSRICGDAAMGWTMGELCEETYFFMAVNVPVKQARMSPKCYENRPTDRPTSTGAAQSKTHMMSSREVEVSMYGATVKAPIAVEHVELFDSMRKSVIGKSRGPKEFKDHVSRCKVAAKGNMSDSGVSIDAQQLSDLARLSFMIDFEDNYKGDSQMFSQAYATTIQADHLYKHGNGLVTMGTISVLSEMLMDAVESKNWQMAGIKALRSGLGAAQRRGVLNSVK
jgi:hypothetical protein